MVARSEGGGKIAAYGYGAPTEAEVVASLARVFGPQRGAEAWAKACRTAGVAVGAVNTTQEVERCARALATEGGAYATVARSVDIRMRTYTRLAATAAAPVGGGTRA